MALFISSRSVARLHDVYAEQRTPPAVIQPSGTGVACVVEQFPWGPPQVLTTLGGIKDLITTFAPFGMSHLGSGYLACIRKGFPVLKVVRVMATSGTAKASAALNKTGPTLLITLTLKYEGSGGNSVTWVTAAASDGDANHFNLTVSVSDAYGNQTVDTLQNLNYSGTGADSAPDFNKLTLLGAIAKSSSGVPIVTSGTFSGGLDGTVAAGDYVGTQGLGNKGFALMEGDRSIRHFFVGDPGNSFRSTVNAGAYAHAVFSGNRVAYVNGNSGQTAAAARADALNYPSEFVAYVDAWAYIYDDVTGTKRLVPSAPFGAAVCSQISPSTSPAWKSIEVGNLLAGIVDLEADRGGDAATNSEGGVMTLIREPSGGFRFEAGYTTVTVSDPTRKRITRTAMGIYMAASMQQSLRPSVDGPNVPLTQQRVLDAIQIFMEGLIVNRNTDPEHKPYVVAYDIPALSGFNSKSDLANGDFTVPINVTLDAGMERIFLSFNLTTGTVTFT